MATTWATLASEGKGEPVYILQITGIGVFTTYSYTPTDAWYTSSGYTSSQLHPWLCYEGLGPIVEKIDFLEADLRVEPLQCTIADVGGGFTSLLRDVRATTHTFLVSSTYATRATIKVLDTSDFGATGNLWIGQEVCSYTGKTATTFTGLTRGLFGTTAKGYEADPTAETPLMPLVAAQACSLVNRRAYLRAAVINPGTGAPGAASIIYRGTVGRGIVIGRGRATLPINHISEVLRKKFAQRLPSSTIQPGYWYAEGSELNSVHFTVQVNNGTIADDEYLEITEGRYTASSLAAEINAELDALGMDIAPELDFTEERYKLIADPVANKRLVFSVKRGDPLYALGFAEGYYSGNFNTAFEALAQDSPRPLLVDLDARGFGHRPELEVEDAEVFEDGLWVAPPGGCAVQIHNNTGTTITLESGLAGRDVRRWRHRRYWLIEDPENLTLRHLFYSKTLLSDCLLTALYLKAGQFEPESWCAQGLLEADLDTDELDDCLAGLPVHLTLWEDAPGAQGVELWRVFGPPLAVLAICPRIIDGGRIGFVRLQTPTLTAADTVQVDDELWSLLEAGQIEARLNDAPLVNAIVVQHSHDYRAEGDSGSDDPEWGSKLSFYWLDGLNQLGENRNVEYEIRGWLADSGGISLTGLFQSLNREVTATHFGIFGRESPTVAIPCTWTAKQILCGDIVRVTHELLPDTAEATVGMSDRLGIVVGRTLQLDPGANQPDQLLVRFVPELHAWGIAPCVFAETWTALTKKLSCPNAATPQYAQDGDNDLDSFKAAYDASELKLQIWEYNSETPTIWSGTMAGVDVAAGTITLTADPFGGMFPADGAYVIFDDWDDAGATVQQVYAYVATSSATPTVGSVGDEGFEWTI